MNNNNISELKEMLAKPQRIAITMHQKPDGDAIGSALGLYHFLKGEGHRVDVVAPTDFPENLKWIPGANQVLIGPNDTDRAKWIFDGADLIFCLDFNALHRINEFKPVVEDSMGKKIMIDHHLDPAGFEDLAFWDPEASSTAELVYRLISELGKKDQITKEMGDALYTGIMTDTGSFRFTNTSPAVHRIIAHLMEVGVDVTFIHDALFNNSSVDRLKFIGHSLGNCLHVFPDYHAAYIKLDREVFKRFNLRPGDTEGLVSYTLSIKNIYLGVLITTQDDIVKLSFRSRSGVSSVTFAQEFNGGGHFYAAGGRTKESLEQVEARLQSLFETHKEMLKGVETERV
ncbi:MAG: bifunctional oligoribonuclease/PAP phosphatase NrnA [Bacteroidota bacterium]